MRCFVFSIGESTTDLCCELMKEYGFEVILFQDKSSLWDKLKRFYTEALQTNDNGFFRIDADIIPNRNTLKLKPLGWQCAVGYDWYKQDRGPISIHAMDRDIVKMCLQNIESARDKIRPETHLWRVIKINPYTKIVNSFSCGLHGYGQIEHRQRIKELKYNRNQEYDWELIDKIEALE